MEDKAIAYQQQMQAQYKSTAKYHPHESTDKTHCYQAEVQTAYGKMRNLYNYAAAAAFKEQYSPADPFEGVQVPAEFLTISELVAVFKGANALKNEGNGAFIPELVETRQESQTPLIRVDRFWLQSYQWRKRRMCEYLYKVFFDFDNAEEIHSYELSLGYANDLQLDEYVRQAQEALATVDAEVVNEI